MALGEGLSAGLFGPPPGLGFRPGRLCLETDCVSGSPQVCLVRSKFPLVKQQLCARH